MELGTAIKTIRKQKGYSQKDLASKCEISVNTLCQIETNATFPHKSTLRKICDILEIPSSYLLFFSISDEDVPKDKLKTFNILSKSIKELLLDNN